jgi:dolichyl-phosphate beta-glucosyltransferase
MLTFQIYLLVVYFSNEPRPLSDDERMFNDIRTGKQLKFPSLKQQGSTADVYLSIVIPAYNEEHRLPSMLDQTLEYLENRRRLSAEQSFTFEVLIVDDGSRDGTADTAINWATHRMKLKWPKLSMDMSPCDIRVLRFKRNRGKGGAVTQVSPEFIKNYTISNTSGSNLRQRQVYHIRRCRWRIQD